MKSIIDFALNEEYERVKQLGDRLMEIESVIDWGAFRRIVGEMYENKSERGGRPNHDEVLMVKLLVLQQWHGLSDPELEKQVTDRISFRKFLGFNSRCDFYYFRSWTCQC
jgi:IS5 family transposase